MNSALYVIDVMPLLYRGHFAFLSKPRLTATGVNTSALTGFVSTVLQILDTRSPSHVVLVLDSRTPTFRHEAYPPYKANRQKMPEDIAASIPMAEEFARAMNIKCVHVDGFEADDLMGAYAAAAKGAGLTTYLVTGDKDIAQLVDESTFLYRIGKNDPEIMGVGEVCAHWGISSPRQMIDLLALAGDSSDNIPGIRGIGEKTAQSLISQYGGIENLISHASELKGKTAEKVAAGAEDARTSYFLATIRTDVPLPTDIPSLEKQDCDRDAVAAFCKKFELATAARRILGASATAAAEDARPENRQAQQNAATADLPLFCAFSASGAETESEAREAAREPELSQGRGKYTLVDDSAKLADLAKSLLASSRFAFDTETTGTDPRTCGLVGISFSTEPFTGYYVPYENNKAAGASWKEEVTAALAPIFADKDKIKIGHNARFDCTVLARHSMKVAGVCRDTLLTHFVIDSAARHGMDTLAVEYLSYRPIPISTLIGEGKNADPGLMATAPLEKICEYAAEDADVTLRLHDVLRPVAERDGMIKALEECEEPLAQVLSEMEAEGVRIDTEALRRFGDELEKEIERVKNAIYAAAGTEFNINSPKQLGEILFGTLKIDASAKKLPSGQYATGEEILQKLVGRHPVVQMILDYRTYSKLKSTYADKLPGCIDPATGRVHTHFSQAFTETGRLASSDPNLQNIPVRTELGKRIREAFVPRDSGHLLLSADYSQIELRIMAALSGDPSMIEAFKRGADIHTETASRVYGVMAELVTPEMRSRCKMVNFGIIYGISAFGLSQRLGIPRAEAATLIESYFRQYPGIREFMEKSVENAREKGYAETIFGRRRPLRDISSRNATVRQAAERNAINTPVQGSAADLIKTAMVRVDRAIKETGLKTRLVLQIHDELLFDMPVEEETAVREIVRREMVNAIDFGVPLEVEIGVGHNWLEAH